MQRVVYANARHSKDAICNQAVVVQMLQVKQRFPGQRMTCVSVHSCHDVVFQA